jgi:hypothetical protein
MTTTVAKGTNRPAAAARRTRAAQKPPTTAPKASAPATATGTLPEDFPGAKKIARLVDGAREAGWTPTLSDLDAKTGAATVTCSRGEESIRSEFIAGKSAGYSFHTQVGGKVRRLNNVSAVLHVMAGLTPSGHSLPVPAPAEDPTPAAPTAARPARSRKQTSPKSAAA